MRDQHSDFRAYPFLTPEEFAEVCHRLDRRYCQATLGPVRRQWKLRVCMALNTSAAFTLGPEYSTYLQIIRPLEGEPDDGDLSACLHGFSFGDSAGSGSVGVGMEEEADREMMEAEEADQVRIRSCRGIWLYRLWNLTIHTNEQGGHAQDARSLPNWPRARSI
jgi:ubiquitin-like-conjugating enzyme ATG10